MKRISYLLYFLLIEFFGLFLLRNPFRNHKERNRKLSICGGCEDFEGGKCLRCGCYMRLKSWFKRANCPVNKW